MKKRSYILAVAAMAAAVMLAGCESKEQGSADNAQNADAGSAAGSSDAALDFKVSDYVKLGDYKGLEVTYPAVLEVTDEDVQQYIQDELEGNTEYEEVKDRAAEVGDVVNIDYSGTMDGEEFEGGTDTGYDLELGSGDFLDEFENSLVGKKTGETAVFKLTFPDDYDASLAGKEAEFTVKVNSISESAVPEYNDEYVQSISECETVKEYEESVREQLETEAEDESETEAREHALRLVMESATLDGYPQQLYDFFYEDTETGYKNYAEFMGMEYEEFLGSYVTEEEIADLALDQTNEYLVTQAILEKEGKEISDSDYKKLAEEMAKENDYDTLEEYENDYGATYVRTQLIREKAIDILYESAKLKEIPYDEYHADDDVDELGSSDGEEVELDLSDEGEGEELDLSELGELELN